MNIRAYIRYSISVKMIDSNVRSWEMRLEIQDNGTMMYSFLYCSNIQELSDNRSFKWKFQEVRRFCETLKVRPNISFEEDIIHFSLLHELLMSP